MIHSRFTLVWIDIQQEVTAVHASSITVLYLIVKNVFAERDNFPILSTLDLQERDRFPFTHPEWADAFA